MFIVESYGLAVALCYDALLGIVGKYSEVGGQDLAL